MTNDSPQDYAMLAYLIASQYVAEPARLRIVGEKRGDKIIVRFPGKHLKVDHGRLIGRQGDTYRALRTLLQQAAGKQTLYLDVLDPGGDKERGEDVPLDLNWNKDAVFRDALEMIAEKVFGWPVPVRASSAYDRTYLTLEMDNIEPAVLSAFQIIWKAIGRQHGRIFVLVAESPKAVANG